MLSLLKGVGGIGALSIALATAGAASAAGFDFVMHGWLAPGTSVAGTTLTTDTQFTLRARFDTSSGNLVAALPFPGFVAYSPSSITLATLGHSYSVQPYDLATHMGLSVAIFDATTPFGFGHYAAGVIQDPVADGAGMVGDWLTASPPFSAANLVPTSFDAAQFFGVGFGSGVSGVDPIPISLGGTMYQLIFPNMDLTYQAYNIQPSTDKLWSAALSAVPEPASWAMMLVGFAVVGAAARQRRAPA